MMSLLWGLKRAGAMVAAPPEPAAASVPAHCQAQLKLHSPPMDLGLPSLPSGPKAGSRWPLAAE